MGNGPSYEEIQKKNENYYNYRKDKPDVNAYRQHAMFNGRHVTEKEIRREIRKEQYSGNGSSAFNAYKPKHR